MRLPSAFSKKFRQAGFTLIELLVVIAIIGMLMAAAFAAYSTAQKSGRDTRREADMRAISQAMEQYRASNNAYPIAYNTTLLTATYLPNGLPIDPKTGTAYAPIIDPAGTGYCACAALENAKGNSTTQPATFVCTVTTTGSPPAGVSGYFCLSAQQ